MNRFLLILMSSFVLAACGGGGGGGGSSSGGSDDDDNGSTSPVYVVQNEYLPLIEGTGWEYEGGATVNVIASTVVDGAFGLTSVVDDTNPNSIQTVTQIYSSTESAVQMHGLTAENISAGGVTVQSILFGDNPVEIIGENLSSSTFSAQLRVAEWPLPISVNVTPSITIDDEAEYDFDNQGDIPAIEVEVDLVITGSFLSNNIRLDVRETATYVRGVGIVDRNTYVYMDEDFSSSIVTVELDYESLNGIPEPVIFETRNSVITPPDDVTIRTDELLAPNDFSILNSDDIDTRDWLTVEANVSDTAYEIDVTNAADVPTDTETFVVYVGGGTSARYPVNVTLIVLPNIVP